MYTLRFDMRSPSGGPATCELYAAAVEMTAWQWQSSCPSTTGYATATFHHR